MTSFLAIVKLTCRSALRSYIFRLLLFFLLLGIFVLPLTLISDGTLKGEIQLILQYSLGFVFTILMISSVWLTCSEISTDVENGQIHPVIVKPVHRAKVLFAKFTGVVLIHLALLLFSSVVIYGFVIVKSSATQWFTGSSRFLTEAELKEIETVKQQVFTARKKYAPTFPDIQQLAQEEFLKRKEEARRNNQDLTNYEISTTSNDMLNDIRQELEQQSTVVKPQEVLTWHFDGLDSKIDKQIFLQYTIYPIGGLTSEQELTKGAWFYRVIYARQDEATGQVDVVNDVYSEEPEEIFTVMSHEAGIPVKPEYLIYQNSLELGFVNLDDRNNELLFDKTKGPYLLVPAAGFLNNYARGIAIMAMGIIALTLVAAACSAFFSLPIAIFFSVTYIFAGLISAYLISTFESIPGYNPLAIESYGLFAGKLFMVLLVPLQDFFITGQLSNGELIEWSTIFGTFFYDIVLRSLPLYLIGTILYCRREIAIVLKR